MHRLFVAIRPPAPIREQLLGMMGGVPGARWQDDEQLHITLRFLGEVDRHQAEDIAAALGSVRHQPFRIALSGVGHFSSRGRGAIWAGLTPHDMLGSLHRNVDGACRRVGVAPDGRAYLPHITIARIGRGSASPEPFVAQWAGLSSAPFDVSDFRLFESRLGSEGASYTAIARYPLG